MYKLSKRLLLIAKQVNYKDIICDIGTDHAMIPIYLAKKKIIIKAYVCDIAKQPLIQAKNNIIKYKVEKIITPILGNGLIPFTNIQINSCIISGLGNATILTILQQESNLINRYILCPNDDNTQLLRKWIKNKKYFIEKELLIKDNKIIYEIIVVNKIYGKKVNNKKDLIFGPFLLKEHNKLFQEKWLLKINYYLTLLNKIPIKIKRYQKIKTKLKMINKVIYNVN